MGTNDFQIGLVGKLDANQSKQQLNSDIDALKKQLNTVEVQAQLGKDVVSKLTQQLNATQFTINNVKVDQTAINNMISQFNTAFSKVNINLGNINTNGATRDLSSFKEQMDLLDYFQGKKIFVGDKAEAIQNTGMSIRELNNQFRNLGVTFTTVENGSTKLDEIWSELFNIKPSFQGIDSFGGQINAVVNELKIAKEAMYGDSNLMPAQRTGATTTYLNAWLEMLEKLSQRIEILKTEQANLQNQMAQASNNATNAVVANQQKQQQAYQQTGSVIQAVTSNTSVIGNMPKEASDIGDAKNQLSQLLQNEKAVIATTQHFDNDGMMRTFTLNVKRATGEVESLNYAFRQVTDNNGNVTDTYFENTSSHLNDSGAIKQIDAIEEAFSDYTTEIAKFKSTNAEILSGLDTPLKDFETKLAGLKTGASTVNEVKSAFNSLNTEAAKITQNFSKQLSPIDRAVSKIANGEETIRGLRAELKGLDNAPKDLSKELNQCAKALQKVKDIEANEGRTENWSKAYKQWAESIDAVTSKIKTLKKEQSNVASTQVFNTSDLKANNIAYMSKVHNTIEKQMVEINRLANANGWSDVKVTGVEEASGKIQKLTLTVRDAEGALKQFNMQREKIQGNGKTQAGLVQTGDVKVLETAVQYAEKLKSIESSMGQFGNTTTSIVNLENSFTKLGLSTDEVSSKMKAVKTEYTTLQNMMNNDASGNEIVNQFEKLKSELKKSQNEVTQLKTQLDQIYNPNKQLRLSNNIQEWLQKNTKAARDAKEQLEKYYQELNSGAAVPVNILNQISDEFEKIKITQRGLGKLGKNLKDQMAQAVTSFSQWISISSAVMLGVGKFKDAISELKELDDILTEISKTSNLTSSQLKELGNSAFDSASEYGKSASDYLTGVQEMYRAGFENASEMSELSILAQSAGDMTAEMSNDYLIATSAAYDLKGNVKDLNDVLDGQNYITNNAAVSMSDMASATSEAASIASQYGVKINELSSLIAVATAKTRESGSETGNALKSLFINLQDTTSDPIRKAFEAVGISMTKMVNGAEKLKTPIELLKELSKAFNELPEGDTRRANILSDIGGKWHANTLSAILSDWSSFEKMESLYSQGSGSALQEAEKSANNLSGSLEKLSNDWTSFVQNIVNSDGLKTGVNLLDGLLKVVTSLSDGLNSLGSFGTIGTLVGLVQSITGHGENVLRPSF